MYHPIEGGSVVDVQGLPCHIPPVGKIFDPLKGRYIDVPVYRRNTKSFAECYWEPDPRWKIFPKWEREESEMQAGAIARNKKLAPGQKPEPLPPHHELNKFRKEMWQYRLGGFWFYNNTEPTYITGVHWFYLSVYHAVFDTPDRLPRFRYVDRLFFYAWEYAKGDPHCYGLIEITKRRSGKTYRSGCIAIEASSANDNFQSGMQSKNEKDAKSVFQKAIIAPYRKLPAFFQPVSTMGKSGKVTTTELRFSSNQAEWEDNELESWIDWRSSAQDAYDGQRLGFYLADEVGKTMECKVDERWDTVKPCLLDDNLCIIGKTIHTTTVEDMESGGKPFKKLWDGSDQNNRNGNDYTLTGMYRLFFPADMSGDPDKYGFTDVAAMRQKILQQREGLSSHALSSTMRKYPLDLAEAFSLEADECKYDPIALNNRRTALLSMEPAYKRGNFKRKDAVPDGEVIFTETPVGHWLVCWLPEERFRNVRRERGDQYFPGCTDQGAMGCDPYDHQVLEKASIKTMSMGGIVVMKKPTIEGSMPNVEGTPCAIYQYRPDSPNELYEECLMAAQYYGVQVLVETNKPGCMNYFIDRGYGGYLYKQEGKPKPGIVSQSNSKGAGVPGMITDITEQFIHDDLDKVWFPQLLEQWLEWSPLDTTKYDLAVAFGYACMLLKRTLAREDRRKKSSSRVLAVDQYMPFMRRRNKTLY